MSSIVTYVPRPQPTLGNDQLYLQQELAAISGAGKTLTNQVNTNTTNIASLKASRTTDEGNISSLLSSRTTDEANISTIQSNQTAARAAWTTYTPTLTPASGALTSASASGRYLQIGKTVHISILITITTVGTATGNLSVSLPVAAGANFYGALTGSETAISGYLLKGWIGPSYTTAVFNKYDGTTVMASGVHHWISGIYESA